MSMVVKNGEKRVEGTRADRGSAPPLMIGALQRLDSLPRSASSRLMWLASRVTPVA